METEFIYYRHTTPIGVRIEEITGYEQLSGPNWVAFAKQVFSENSKDGYRVIDHYDSGAPFLDGESSRISVSHTGHMLVVASLPKTPVMSKICGPFPSPTRVKRKAFITLPK